MGVQIYDPKEDKAEDIYLQLYETVEGIALLAKDKKGSTKYSILTIKDGSVYFYNLKAFVNSKEPIKIVPGIEDGGYRINISRM